MLEGLANTIDLITLVVQTLLPREVRDRVRAWGDLGMPTKAARAFSVVMVVLREWHCASQ